jgi:diguanylate cyclase (GGDEF)-like protein/PAS domain S-box-containing protein
MTHVLRRSLRFYTALLLVGLVAAVALVAVVARQSAALRVRSSAVVQRQLTVMAAYQDARIAAQNQNSNVAAYNTLHDDFYIASFDEERTYVTDAFNTLDAALGPDQAAQRAEVAELRTEHDQISATLTLVLARLRANDLAGAGLLALSRDLPDQATAFLNRLGANAAAARADLLQAEVDDHAAQAQSDREGLAIIAAWTALIIVAAVGAFFWVLLPIERIARAARTIADGDLTATVPTAGPLELVTLGADVNRMAGALIRRSDELNVYLSKNLESRTIQLEESERRFRALVQNATDLVIVFDRLGNIRYVSPSVERVLGFAPDELVGTNLARLVHEDDILDLTEAARHAVRSSGALPPTEARIRRRDGAWRYVEGVATNLLDDPGVNGIVVNARDITERKRFESRLVNQARHDGLTGLLNGNALREELERLVAQSLQSGAGGAVIFLDLDGFKDVNDTHGHGAGDDVLIELSATLSAELRHGDLLGRIGGDEFVVVMPAATLAETSLAADRLLSAIRHGWFRAGEHRIGITASMGIAVFPDDGRTADDVLARADTAMYRAKHNGRNRVTVFQSGMEAGSGDRLDSQRRLRDALDGDRLLFYAQPLLDFRTDTVTAYELLLRVRGDNGEVLLPAAFLHDAESSGLLDEVDRWVALHAIRIAAETRRCGDAVYFSANLSAKALGDPGLIDLIRGECAATGLDPKWLIFEITEQAAITNIDQALLFMEELRGIGFTFALDDFGVGFSSLSRLKLLPVSFLKLDGTFVQGLPRHPVDQSFVQTMVSLAHSLGVRTVAEYVEDEATLDLVRSYGVHFAQGFHIGEPAPLEHWLTSADHLLLEWPPTPDQHQHAA